RCGKTAALGHPDEGIHFGGGGAIHEFGSRINGTISRLYCSNSIILSRPRTEGGPYMFREIEPRPRNKGALRHPDGSINFDAYRERARHAPSAASNGPLKGAVA